MSVLRIRKFASPYVVASIQSDKALGNYRGKSSYVQQLLIGIGFDLAHRASREFAVETFESVYQLSIGRLGEAAMTQRKMFLSLIAFYGILNNPLRPSTH
jgi:hypothetical protein